MLIIFIIIVIIAVVYMKNSESANSIKTGGREEIVDALVTRYGRVRGYIREFGVDIVSVGTYYFELDGEVSASSRYMSVCVRSESDLGVETAKKLNMEIMDCNVTYYYQLPLKGEGFSSAEKDAILERVASKIRTLYTNDYLKMYSGLLMGAVERKELMERAGYSDQ